MTSTTTATSSLLSPQVLCFDVYGTLIDWETGLHTAATEHLLSQLPSPPPSRDEFLKTYLSYEAAQQRATPDMTYASLLAAVYRQLMAHYSLPASSESESEAAAFGASVGQWPAFADSLAALAALKGRFKLVVLSNVDRASFQGSLSRLSGGTDSGGDGVGIFDLVLTAQDIGSYKPSLHNFEFMLREVRERWGIDKGSVCVVANSLFHDHVPAKRLGLQSVWIERPGAVMGVDANTHGASWEWSFKTLGEMAQSVETLARQVADA